MNTRRRVELSATVDGQPAGAFGVMSQGDLHALALAPFLPGRPAENSPFGFLGIDDPVAGHGPRQGRRAGPGAARDRERPAGRRPHPRRPAARSGPPAADPRPDPRSPPGRRLRRRRRPRELQPAERYLSDARAFVRDDAVPADVVASVVPELCRLALEATCRDAWFRARLLAGDSRVDAEARWTAALSTRARLALAVTGSATATLDPWLSAHGHRAALGVCTTAVHQGLKGNPLNGIDDVRAVVRELAGHAR